MIQVGQTYTYRVYMYDFSFLVLNEIDDFRMSRNDPEPKPGFRLLMLSGAFVTVSHHHGEVQAGSTFDVGMGSPIAIDSESMI